jgi:GBP family porin
MYKKIIAILAISIAMSEAQAQSSVTLSGIIDGGLSFTNGVGAPDKNQWAYGQANLIVSRLIFFGGGGPRRRDTGAVQTRIRFSFR